MKRGELFKKIDKKFIPTLINTEYKYRKFIITFFGVPGSGKTTLSKIIAKKFKGVIINNDKIREIVIKERLANGLEEIEKILQEYNRYLLKNMPFKNRRIILDKSMDRRFKEFKKLFDQNLFQYITIRLHSSKKNAIENISKREKITQSLRKSMDRWFKEYENSASIFKEDILLQSENPNLEKLYKKLSNQFK